MPGEESSSFFCYFGSEDTSAEEKEAAGTLLPFPSSGSYCPHSAGWFQAPSVFYPGEDSDLGDRVF